MEPKRAGVKKRVLANERERERTKSLNQALEVLRNRIPAPEAEKRSKIQTLRMAKLYIEFLAKFKHIKSQQVYDTSPQQLFSDSGFWRIVYSQCEIAEASDPAPQNTT